MIVGGIAVALLALAFLVGPSEDTAGGGVIRDEGADPAAEAPEQSAGPRADCAPPDDCWGAYWYDEAETPCWRAIESAASAIGRWNWRGIGRLSHHTSLPNGNVLYFGERMQIVGADGLERAYHYTCVFFPETGEVTVPVLEPGALRR
jgi:hypothetical protein